MKRFIVKILVYVGLLAVLFCGLCILICAKGTAKETNLPANVIYVWGDSQIYQGLILSDLQQTLQKSVFSAAAHGSGVYDLLVFADKVPAGSMCIVAYSQCCLLRRKDRDGNSSGANLFALKECAKQHYTYSEIKKIYGKNRLHPKPIFHTEDSYLYPYSTEITFSEPLSGFEKMFAHEPSYYRDKLALMRCALDKLNGKGCQVYIVAFPFHQLTGTLYQKSPYREVLDEDIKQLALSYSVGHIDSLYFADGDSLCMHDLTHLNEVGARRATKVLKQYISDTKSTNGNHLIILNGLICK
ncbi:MAG: hypothetical protein ACI30J_03885 [Paludibacteraceae bacterium]